LLDIKISKAKFIPTLKKKPRYNSFPFWRELFCSAKNNSRERIFL